jgi:hypothetical protein
MLNHSYWPSLIWFFLVVGGTFGFAILLEVFGWCNVSSMFGTEETEKWDKAAMKNEKELADAIFGEERDQDSILDEASRWLWGERVNNVHEGDDDDDDDDGGWAIEAAEIIRQGGGRVSNREAARMVGEGGCSVGDRLVDCACCPPRGSKKPKPAYVPRSRSQFVLGEGKISCLASLISHLPYFHFVDAENEAQKLALIQRARKGEPQLLIGWRLDLSKWYRASAFLIRSVCSHLVFCVGQDGQ